jgi:hypothetical protein
LGGYLLRVLFLGKIWSYGSGERGRTSWARSERSVNKSGQTDPVRPLREPVENLEAVPCFRR